MSHDRKMHVHLEQDVTFCKKPLGAIKTTKFYDSPTKDARAF
jgi:hypothetical protein